MFLKNFVISLTMSILVGAGAVAAQTSDRAAQLQGILDGLESSDPIVRLTALDTAMASGDDVLMDYALTAALNSSDRQLATAAIQAKLSARNVLIVSFDNPRVRHTHSGDTALAQDLLLGTGGQFDLKMDWSAAGSQNFWGSSNYTYEEKFLGSYSSDSISFKVDLGNASVWTYCSGSAKHQPGTTKLIGKLGCENNDNIASFDIEIDLIG